MILTEWLARYFRLKPDLKETTALIYREAAWHLLAAFGAREMGTITRLEVAEFRAALAQGRSQNTVAKLIAACRTIFDEAWNVDLIEVNPFDRQSTTRQKTAKLWPELTPAQTTSLLAACPDDRWRACFGLCRYAALRIGEVRRLYWAEIDFDARSIRVMPEGGIEGTKQALRLVPIVPDLLALLLRAYEAAPEGSEGPCRSLPAQIYRPAQAIVEAAGLKRWSDMFHTLRRMRISEWGSDPLISDRALADMAGHDAAVARALYHRTTKAAFDRITGA